MGQVANLGLSKSCWSKNGRCQLSQLSNLQRGKKGKWGLNVWTPQRFGDAKYFDLGIPTNVCEGGLVATCCAKCADTTVSLVSWSLVGCRSELSKKFSRSTSELWTGGKQRPSPTQPLKRVTSKWIGRYHLLAFGASHFQHAAFYPQFW